MIYILIVNDRLLYSAVQEHKFYAMYACHYNCIAGLIVFIYKLRSVPNVHRVESSAFIQNNVYIGIDDITTVKDKQDEAQLQSQAQ